MTYTDNTQASFDLRFDDWTLGGSSAKVGSYNQIALTSAHRVDQNSNNGSTRPTSITGTRNSTKRTVRASPCRTRPPAAP